jgi:adenine deaminase
MSRGWLAPGGSRPASAHVRGPARDLLVTGANIVDVVTHAVFRGWFTVLDGRFVEVEEGDGPLPGEVEAAEVVDLGGAYVQPGMLDVHMHIESSNVTPRRFAEGALPRGTTTVLQDPHEVANVLGGPGIRWMVEASRGLPLRVYSAISSCVPATSPDIETPNASITPAEVAELAAEPDVLALGEVMDFQGLIAGDDHLSAMVAAAHASALSVEGHVPSLTGTELSRYVAFGVRSDHTLMTAPKLLEQLRKGQWVMVQEKSVTPEVVNAVMGLPDRSRVILITDDVMPNRLLSGHLDRIVSLAVQRGWDPVDAIASATLRPASYLGMADLGLVAPGALADFVVTDGLAAYPPRRVYVGGRLVAEDGRVVVPSAPSPEPSSPAGLAQAFDPELPRRDWFTLPADGSVRARVIVTNERNSFTTLDERVVDVSDGVPSDDDLTLATVVPRAALRPGAGGYRPVVGLVAGLGLRRGAYATTFAHDSHNLFVVGRDPDAMLSATRAVLAAGGGMAFAASANADPVLLPLPLAGLLSDDPVPEVAKRFDDIERALVDAGMRHVNPLLLLTLLPLSVSPDFKITDKGVIDVQGRVVLPPLVEA